jgi:hypothetical protein
MPSRYTEVGNLRVTYVPAAERRPEANWAGSDVIRIQAYKNDPALSKALYLGAEFPVSSERELEELIDAIRTAFRLGRA